MRTCIHCNVEQDDSEFYVSKADPNGKQVWCKSCQKNYNLIRYQNAKKNDPDFFKKRNEYQKQYARKQRRDAGLPERCERGTYTGVICKILKEHHEELKDDPERLSSEFLQVILGRRCKNENHNS